MQKNRLFSILFVAMILFAIFSPFFLSLKLQKVYNYSLHTDTLDAQSYTISPVRTASLQDASPVYSYSMSGRLSFASPRTTVYLAIAPSVDPEMSSDIQIDWILDGERYTRILDFDGNGGKSDGEKFFTFPFVAKPFHEVAYILTSRVPLHASDITVISANNDEYSERLTLRSDTVSADQNVAIVSRAEWGADEGLRYISTSKVAKDQKAYQDRGSQPEVVYETEKEENARKRANVMFDESRGVAPDFMKTVTKMRTENGRKLAWPVETVKGVQAIVIHHTAENMQKDLDDMVLLRAIYQYHAITRGWGDIGYNYIIGQRGQIYEGRAGGDYVVGAHAAWNNAGTVGISVMGDFMNMTLNKDQEAGLHRAIVHFAKKYGVDIRATVPGVKECKSSDCGLFIHLNNTALMGHQDVGTTDCPGDNLYALLANYRETLPSEIGPVTPVWNPRTPFIEPLAPEDETTYVRKGSQTLFRKTDSSTPIANTFLPSFIPTSQPSPATLLPLPETPPGFLGQNVRVKLSYPEGGYMTLQSATKNRLFLVVDKRRVLIPYTQPIQISLASGSLLEATVGARKYQGSTLTIEGVLIRIPSWNRVPSWDSVGKYNDNIFRKQIVLRNDGGMLQVVNELPVELYLRGMGEVSEGDAETTPEKAKTIIVGARSYARYYSDLTLPDTMRKFPGKPYDLSDDPDVSQKYLGYGYEMRSPSVASLVDATRGEVVTYGGKIIKVWYSSSTDGRTRSYLEYCQSSGKTDCEDIPYLQSVDDPGAVGRTRNGHGVGISGIGATYFANQGWEYKDIIQYYLPGVAIEKR